MAIPIEMWTAVTKTHTGNVRANNEDLALWDSGLGALVIADGMGGHNAGEVASRLAVESLHKSLQQTALLGMQAVDRLHRAVTQANREVFDTSNERPDCAGMGTTMTAALVEGARVAYASVGDSRLYTLKNGVLQQMTRDDSLMGALTSVVGIGPAELEHHPMRHLLTSVVGRKAELDVTVDELTLADGQMLLLSTDGLHGVLPAESIASILRTDPDLDRAAQLLIAAALGANSKDNVTVALARYTSSTS
jgi:protein phosphatase